MRKTTTYARKRGPGHTYNGAEFLHTIIRSQQYTVDVIPGALEGSQSAATRAMLIVRQAFLAISSGRAADTGEDDCDHIAHALGVACIRAGKIAGLDPEQNALLPPLIAATQAMRACIERYRKWHKWELLKSEADSVLYGIEVYEQILQASSPAQMTEATEQRIKAIRAMTADGVAVLS